MQLFFLTDDNGFNPIFMDSFDFNIHNPELSFMRFIVYDQDMFGEPNLLALSTIPVKCMKSGESLSQTA